MIAAPIDGISLYADGLRPGTPGFPSLQVEEQCTCQQEYGVCPQGCAHGGHVRKAAQHGWADHQPYEHAGSQGTSCHISVTKQSEGLADSSHATEGLAYLGSAA